MNSLTRVMYTLTRCCCARIRLACCSFFIFYLHKGRGRGDFYMSAQEKREGEFKLMTNRIIRRGLQLIELSFGDSCML
jgi:hypothetical protein